MSLVVFAIGVEMYQVLAHVHCFSGRTLPDSHRSTLGFGAAILGDVLSYFFSTVLLYTAGAQWWWLLAPLLAHVFYWCLLVFYRSLYMRIHDYRMRTIYADGTFARSKRIAALLDTCFHVLAFVLLARQAPALVSLGFAAVGLVGYLSVFGARQFAADVLSIRTWRTKSGSISLPSITRRWRSP